MYDTFPFHTKTLGDKLSTIDQALTCIIKLRDLTTLLEILNYAFCAASRFGLPRGVLYTGALPTSFSTARFSSIIILLATIRLTV